jgi:LysM repeat protein
MKYLYISLSLGLAVSVTSCNSNKKTAAASAYQNNPYYGPSGSSYGSSTKDYSSTASSSTYPSYSENTYTPPTQSSTPAQSVPSVPTLSAPAPTYTASASGGSHTVASGENLYRISLKHGTSVAAIKSANGISGETIHPGQVLRIP